MPLPDDFWEDDPVPVKMEPAPSPEPEPEIRRVYPSLVTNQIVSVQPMTRPLSADFIPTEYTFDPIQKHKDLMDALALTLKVESDATT